MSLKIESGVEQASTKALLLLFLLQNGLVPALGPHRTLRKSKVANHLLRKRALTTVLPHIPFGNLFSFLFFPLPLFKVM